MRDLAKALKDESGYTIKDKALIQFRQILAGYEIPRDVAEAYANGLLAILLECLCQWKPEEYDRQYLAQWKEEQEVALKKILVAIENLRTEQQSLMARNINLKSAQEIDLELKRNSIYPRMGISFFVVDDEDFRKKFQQERSAESVYVKGRCREKTIYCVINELWRLDDKRNIFVIRDQESWEKLRVTPSSNNVYIPWFFADDIYPIEGNTTIFVLVAGMPAFEKHVLKLRPRTYRTIFDCMREAGIKDEKAHAILDETHGLYIPMKKKMFKGISMTIPEWKKSLPEKVIKTCLLVGQWTDCEGDRSVVEELSGVPNILQTWDNEDWIEPEISERFNPDRTILKLSFVKRGGLGGDDSTQEPTQATQGVAQDGIKIPTVYSLPELDLAIISLMKKEPAISQTAKATALSANINTLKYRVLKLKEKGIIEREGSSQKGHWIVKL